MCLSKLVHIRINEKINITFQYYTIQNQCTTLLSSARSPRSEKRSLCLHYDSNISLRYIFDSCVPMRRFNEGEIRNVKMLLVSLSLFERHCFSALFTDSIAVKLNSVECSFNRAELLFRSNLLKIKLFKTEYL